MEETKTITTNIFCFSTNLEGYFCIFIHYLMMKNILKVFWIVSDHQIRRPGFKIWQWHQLAGWPAANYPTSCEQLLTCSIDIKWDDAYTMFCSVSGMYIVLWKCRNARTNSITNSRILAIHFGFTNQELLHASYFSLPFFYLSFPAYLSPFLPSVLFCFFSLVEDTKSETSLEEGLALVGRSSPCFSKNKDNFKRNNFSDI